MLEFVKSSSSYCLILTFVFVICEIFYAFSLYIYYIVLIYKTFTYVTITTFIYNTVSHPLQSMLYFMMIAGRWEQNCQVLEQLSRDFRFLCQFSNSCDYIPFTFSFTSNLTNNTGFSDTH